MPGATADLTGTAGMRTAGLGRATLAMSRELPRLHKVPPNGRLQVIIFSFKGES